VRTAASGWKGGILRSTRIFSQPSAQLKAALDRLQSTTIITSIRQPSERRRHRSSWINEWKERIDVTGRPLGIELVLPDWFYAGVLDDALSRHRVRVPETPVYLDALLSDQPLTGELEPRLGDQHLRILTIVGFPTATTPGLLEDLNRLAFPYRWLARAILLDKTDATRLLTKIRRQWFAKRKSIAAILKEVMTNEPSVLVDTDATNKTLDADMALQELGQDVAGMAYVTATITVWDSDPRIADEKLRLHAWLHGPVRRGRCPRHDQRRRPRSAVRSDEIHRPLRSERTQGISAPSNYPLF
jgi:hypothetical protein